MYEEPNDLGLDLFRSRLYLYVFSRKLAGKHVVFLFHIADGFRRL